MNFNLQSQSIRNIYDGCESTIQYQFYNFSKYIKNIENKYQYELNMIFSSIQLYSNNFIICCELLSDFVKQIDTNTENPIFTIDEFMSQLLNVQISVQRVKHQIKLFQNNINKLDIDLEIISYVLRCIYHLMKVMKILVFKSKRILTVCQNIVFELIYDQDNLNYSSDSNSSSSSDIDF